MCLTIKRIRHLNGKAKVAKRDIPCYKVLRVTYDGSLQTPCQYHFVDYDTIVLGLTSDYFERASKSFKIHHGIHSYKKCPKYISASLIVVNAYIPKGTPYWIGYDDEYVSECIRFN